MDADAYDVNDYQTGTTLAGLASVELVRESLAAGPEGAVRAYYDGEEWVYVEPSRVSRVEATQQIRTVYVSRCQS